MTRAVIVGVFLLSIGFPRRPSFPSGLAVVRFVRRLTSPIHLSVDIGTVLEEEIFLGLLGGFPRAPMENLDLAVVWLHVLALVGVQLDLGYRIYDRVIAGTIPDTPRATSTRLGLGLFRLEFPIFDLSPDDRILRVPRRLPAITGRPAGLSSRHVLHLRTRGRFLQTLGDVYDQIVLKDEQRVLEPLLRLAEHLRQLVVARGIGGHASIPLSLEQHLQRLHALALLGKAVTFLADPV